MNILIDAKNEKYIKMIEGLNLRQCGKTDLSTAYLLAYVESKRIGEPVPLSIGFKKLEEYKQEVYNQLNLGGE